MKKTHLFIASAMVAALALPSLQWAGRPGPEAQVRGREVLRRREGGQERLPDRQLVLRRHLAAATARRTPGSTCRRAPASDSSTAARSRGPDDGLERGAAGHDPGPARRRRRAGGVRDRAAGAARRGDPRVAAGARRGSRCTRRTTWAAGPPSRALERSAGTTPSRSTASGSRSAATAALDARHLAPAAGAGRAHRARLVSEHLSWSIAGGAYLNHLLPLPYTEETLAVVAAHVARGAGRARAAAPVENPSSYLRFRHSTIPEPEFLAALARRTGCGLLCDVNNVFVTRRNLGFDPVAYLDALPARRGRRDPPRRPRA